MVNESAFTYKDIKNRHAVKVKKILVSNDFAKTGYFTEIDMRKADEIKGKTKNFSLHAQNKRVYG